jgi:hypothetical protein
MNTKFSFVLFVIVIALIATACTPAIVDSSGPIIDAAQPVNNETIALVPVSGNPAAESVRTESEPRLFSGEILLSDTDNPDAQLNVQTDAQQDLQTGCMSEDSQPERQSGCVE